MVQVAVTFQPPFVFFRKRSDGSYICHIVLHEYDIYIYFDLLFILTLKSIIFIYRQLMRRPAVTKHADWYGIRVHRSEQRHVAPGAFLVAFLFDDKQGVPASILQQ